MRITIESVSTCESGESLVTFRSKSGKAKAVWPCKAPSIGGEYDVEFDVEGPLVWGVDVRSGVGPSSVTLENEQLLMVGRSSSFEDREVIGLQLDDDVVILEVSDLPESIPDWIEVRPRSLRIYSTNL